MINLPPIVGNIRPVPISSYKEIIASYVEKVSKLEQVCAIVKIGSCTAPGISDIDIMVVIKDTKPYPAWEEISLLKLASSHNDSEIVAHDVFAIPESVAKYAEAYFYIDQQHVLKGTRLGGNLQPDVVAKCKEFLALEYAIFSLEVIMNMLLLPAVELRRLILVLSSMRHSARLALEICLIKNHEKDEIVRRIENLRLAVLAMDFSRDEVSNLLEKFIGLLGDTIRHLSQDVSKNILRKEPKKAWHVSSKTAMLGIAKGTDFTEAFIDIINKQKNSSISKYVKILAIPIEAQWHLGAYLHGNEESAIYFRNAFQNIQSFQDMDELNNRARRRRGKVILDHWEFIRSTAYFRSSGRAYFGLSYPQKRNLKRYIRNLMLHYCLFTLKFDA